MKCMRDWIGRGSSAWRNVSKLDPQDILRYGDETPAEAYARVMAERRESAK